MGARRRQAEEVSWHVVRAWARGGGEDDGIRGVEGTWGLVFGAWGPPDTQKPLWGDEVLHGIRPGGMARPLAGRSPALRASESNRRVESDPPSPPDTQKPPCGGFCVSGGEGGIRTPEALLTPA